jgi:hypothetical protein
MDHKSLKGMVRDVLMEAREMGDVRFVRRLGGLVPVAFELSVATSRAAGHLAGEGSGGSPEETSARRATESVARLLATLYGVTVEIYAQDDDGDQWMVGEEEASDDPQEVL